MLKSFSIILLLLLVFSCTGNKASSVSTGGKAQLLAFLNPYGEPCQMQQAILNELGNKVTSKVELKSILTTNPSDQDSFYKYGVRGLPSLILIDKNGEVIKRFSPGIQSGSEIMDALNSCKC